MSADTPVDSPQTVLFIDDDAAFACAFSPLLVGLGHVHVVHLADAQQAGALVVRHQPTLVLIDLSLPGTDGESVLTDLRSRFPTVLIAMLSAADDAESARRCLRGGADDYLCKGLPIPVLLERISELLTAATAEWRPRQRVAQAHADAAIRTALLQAGGRVAVAAAALGISRQALYKRLRTMSWTHPNHLD